MVELEMLLHSDRSNAALGWLLVGCLVALAVWSGLSTDRDWWVVPLAGAAILALPPVTTGDPARMVPWPLIAVVAAASAAGAAGLAVEIVAAVVVATLSVVVTVELSAFTSVDMSRRFGVAFAVLTTMAMQAVVVVLQFYSDQWLGTDYLRGLRELQWDLVSVTLVAIGAGIVFARYIDSSTEPPTARRSGSHP